MSTNVSKLELGKIWLLVFFVISSNMYTLDIFMINTVHQRVDYAHMPIDRDCQPSKCV